MNDRAQCADVWMRISNDPNGCEHDYSLLILRNVFPSHFIIVQLQILNLHIQTSNKTLKTIIYRTHTNALSL